jgi:hypothetical protein
MEMEVRCFLSTKDPVVLKRKYSEGPISLNERLCDSLSRDRYSPAFLVRKIEQRRDMPTRDNATLANFELPRIDHGECMFAFIYHRPSFFATCHPFTKVARLSYGKFDQLPSPIQPAGRRKTLVESALGQHQSMGSLSPGRQLAARSGLSSTEERMNSSALDNAVKEPRHFHQLSPSFDAPRHLLGNMSHVDTAQTDIQPGLSQLDSTPPSTARIRCEERKHHWCTGGPKTYGPCNSCLATPSSKAPYDIWE